MQATSSTSFAAPSLRGEFMGSSAPLQMASRPSVSRAAVSGSTAHKIQQN